MIFFGGSKSSSNHHGFWLLALPAKNKSKLMHQAAHHRLPAIPTWADESPPTPFCVPQKKCFSFWFGILLLVNLSIKFCFGLDLVEHLTKGRSCVLACNGAGQGADRLVRSCVFLAPIRKATTYEEDEKTNFRQDVQEHIASQKIELELAVAADDDVKWGEDKIEKECKNIDTLKANLNDAQKKLDDAKKGGKMTEEQKEEFLQNLDEKAKADRLEKARKEADKHEQKTLKKPQKDLQRAQSQLEKAQQKKAADKSGKKGGVDKELEKVDEAKKQMDEAKKQADDKKRELLEGAEEVPPAQNQEHENQLKEKITKLKQEGGKKQNLQGLQKAVVSAQNKLNTALSAMALVAYVDNEPVPASKKYRGVERGWLVHSQMRKAIEKRDERKLKVKEDLKSARNHLKSEKQKMKGGKDVGTGYADAAHNVKELEDAKEEIDAKKVEAFVSKLPYFREHGDDGEHGEEGPYLALGKVNATSTEYDYLSWSKLFDGRDGCGTHAPWKLVSLSVGSEPVPNVPKSLKEMEELLKTTGAETVRIELDSNCLEVACQYAFEKESGSQGEFVKPIAFFLDKEKEPVRWGSYVLLELYLDAIKSGIRGSVPEYHDHWATLYESFVIPRAADFDVETAGFEAWKRIFQNTIKIAQGQKFWSVGAVEDTYQILVDRIEKKKVRDFACVISILTIFERKFSTGQSKELCMMMLAMCANQDEKDMLPRFETCYTEDDKDSGCIIRNKVRKLFQDLKGEKTVGQWIAYWKISGNDPPG